MKLDRSFYLRKDVIKVSKELLGKVLYTCIGNKRTAGIITETEAYAGVTDRASHAYGGRRTARTEVMYREGGTAYVYLCYGIHSLFNVVTNEKDIPHAVLIRAIHPIEGINTMLKRRNKKQVEKSLASGPGSLSQALGIHYVHTGHSLLGKIMWIEDKGIGIKPSDIIAGPRVGVEYAGEDALLPYRFRVREVSSYLYKKN